MTKDTKTATADKSKTDKSKTEKPQAGVYALKFGHPTPFRRTVKVGEGDDAEDVQLIFEPATPYELTQQEVDGLTREITNGMLVPYVENEYGVQNRPGRPIPVPVQKLSAKGTEKPSDKPAQSESEKVAQHDSGGHSGSHHQTKK